jgi:hypothetical protein
VFEDASPELVRDFFWDDEYRLRWDDMIVHASTIQECEVTGTMIVHWVRKVSMQLPCIVIRCLSNDYGITFLHSHILLFSLATVSLLLQ